MSNILQHNIERFGMVTVMDVVLYDINNNGTQGAPKLFLDTLKMTNINTEGSNKEIRGGIGNDMLISYDFGRTANVEIQDALLSPESLSVLWGAGAQQYVTEISHNVLVENSSAITAGTIKPGSVYVYPVDGSDLAGFTQGQSAIPSFSNKKCRVLWIETKASTTLTDQTQNFTIPASGWVDLIISVPGATSITSVVDSNDVAVPFVFDTNNQTVYIDAAALEAATAGVGVITFAKASGEFKQVTLTNDNFPQAMKLVGESFVIEEKTGKKKKIKIEIPKFKINSNFSFSMDAEGDASVFDFSGVALAQDGELIKIQFLGSY
jgi:hypothetical protein